MKKRNKFLALALCGALAATSLTGCGGNAGGKLTVAIWDNGQQPGLQKILDDFTAATGIQTQLQVIEWNSYWTLLEAGASGGDMPDVFWMHSNEAVRYMSNGILLDITDKVNSSDKLELDKFPQALKDMYTYEGKIYALPKDRHRCNLVQQRYV